jgi:hypothetical protein
MTPATTKIFLSPHAGSREGKRGGAPPTAGPRPTRFLVPGPEAASWSALPLEGVLSGCAKVVGNPAPGDQEP